jgi:multiple sugar transport system permease protein
MLTSEEKWTLPLAIANMQGEMSSDFGLIMAGAALASIPIIVVFIAFQKYFTQGIAMGAVKG